MCSACFCLIYCFQVCHVTNLKEWCFHYNSRCGLIWALGPVSRGLTLLDISSYYSRPHTPAARWTWTFYSYFYILLIIQFYLKYLIHLFIFMLFLYWSWRSSNVISGCWCETCLTLGSWSMPIWTSSSGGGWANTWFHWPAVLLQNTQLHTDEIT